MATTTAGDCETTTTPTTTLTIAACAAGRSERKPSVPRMRNVVAASTTALPSTAMPLIHAIDRNSGFIDRKSISEPAVSAMSATATPFTRPMPATVVSGTNCKSAGPAMMPVAK